MVQEFQIGGISQRYRSPRAKRCADFQLATPRLAKTAPPRTGMNDFGSCALCAGFTVSDCAKHLDGE
jgi:hypothetical protein